MPAKTVKTSKSATARQPITVALNLARETKNTYRYETDAEDAAISTLYINKSAFYDDTAPASIKITVE